MLNLDRRTITGTPLDDRMEIRNVNWDVDDLSRFNSTAPPFFTMKAKYANIRARLMGRNRMMIPAIAGGVNPIIFDVHSKKEFHELMGDNLPHGSNCIQLQIYMYNGEAKPANVVNYGLNETLYYSTWDNLFYLLRQVKWHREA